jgi:hypothetical protein
MQISDLESTVKKLDVKVESRFVHRIKIGQSVQAPGSSVRNFLATLKGQAKQCNYMLKCGGLGARGR